jgi:signal transduction histidine kinase
MERSAHAIGWQELVLSNLSPSPAQKRLAFGVVLALFIGLIITAGPLSRLALGKFPAFIPAYGMAMCVNDSITAALLYAQYSILRSRALLILATGYLLTGLSAIPWMLTFPDVFAPHGLLGAGLQSTASIYILWHAAFVTSVIAYALMKDSGPSRWLSQGSVRAAIFLSVCLAAALVCLMTLLVTKGNALMPHLMLDPLRISHVWLYAAVPTFALMILALLLLWARLRSILDLWLMVVLCAYAIEIALISFPLLERYSAGWYAGRLYGLVSSSLVLLILLQEITLLYARLLSAVLAQRRERDARLLTGDAVSASIAHEVRQPLSGMIMHANAGLRWLDRTPPNCDEARAAFKQIVTDGHRAGTVVENIRAMFKKAAPTWAPLHVDNLVWEALSLLHGDIEAHEIVVDADISERLPLIKGDRVQLQQVLINLITNAIDSMTTMDGHRVLRVIAMMDQSGTVTVSVEDTGSGVDPQTADRIYDPLFTTKPHGMGMGLSICRSIIEAHDGRLWATDNRPSGAAFHFSLPTYSDSAESRSPLASERGHG